MESLHSVSFRFLFSFGSPEVNHMIDCHWFSIDMCDFLEPNPNVLEEIVFGFF